jgi:hypothetical protein
MVTVADPTPPFNNLTLEQAFLARTTTRTRNAPTVTRAAFSAASWTPTAALVGPLDSSTFSLLAVERALAEMESGGKSFSETSY